MKNIRLIAADLDGTLLTDRKQLTERTARALRQAIAAGIHVVPVTGRPMTGIPEEILSIPGIRYVISSNGAVTRDRSEGRDLRTALIDPETAAAIAEMPLERGLIHCVFMDGAGYCEQHFFEMQIARYGGTPLETYVRKSRRITEDLREEIMRKGRRGAENIWISADSSAERDELDRVIRERWPVRTVLTAAADVEVGSAEADKGKALKDLAARIGVRREEIMAVGDNENDLGMLREAGFAVAMGNGSGEIRALADFVTETNERGGAAAVIERILQ